MYYRFKKLREYISGWMNYFGICKFYSGIQGLDEWLRRTNSYVLLETVATWQNKIQESSPN